jgi:hypothetical protein
MDDSLQRAWRKARWQRPAPLPEDFAATVMRRLPSVPPVFRRGDWVVLAAAAMLTAGVVGWNAAGTSPPPMPLFGGHPFPAG